MITYQEFKRKYEGKETDVDGYYGAQCWDLFAKFCQEMGYPVFNCTQTGYVKDIWNLRNSSGILNYFDEVALNDVKQGDWLIWGNSNYAPSSHIAQFDDYIDYQRGYVFGQNQNGVQRATVIRFPYEGVIGVLRPKAYVTSSVIKDKGTWKFALDVPVVIRNGKLGLSGEKTDLQYENGMIVNYDSTYISDGYHFVSYVSNSRIRRSVAVGIVGGALWGTNI